MLRNLLWATSKHDVYLMQNYSVMHWSALRKSSKEVLNVAKPVVPTGKYPRSFTQPLSRVQISTMSVKDNLLVAGGFHGELICKHLNQPDVAFSTKVTTDENAITNAVDIAESPSGSKWVMAANNDAQVRVFDAENFVFLNRFTFPWSVNNTSTSPKQTNGNPRRQSRLLNLRFQLRKSNKHPQRPLRLLILFSMAPKWSNPSNRKPRYNMPSLGHPKHLQIT